jgi:hypothetical protein
VRRAVLAAAVLLACASLVAAQAGKELKSRVETRAVRVVPMIDSSLPGFGLQFADLPPGPAKDTAEYACLTCHSADVLRQQRLSERQWAAAVTKMNGWGADVPEAKRDELIAYLVKNFGPDNDRFKPVVTRPIGR